MALLTEISASGQAETDEKVICYEDYTVGETTYYRGYLNYIPNVNIEGNDSATYGIWSAVSKGGTRYDVKIEGMPTNSEAAENPDLSIDIQNKYLYSTVDDSTYYVRYLAHIPAREKAAPLTFYVPDMRVAGVTEDFFILELPYFHKFCRASCFIYGNPPSSQATIQIRNAIDGGGDIQSLVISADAVNATATFSTILKINGGDKLVFRTANGYDMSDILIALWEV